MFRYLVFTVFFPVPICSVPACYSRPGESENTHLEATHWLRLLKDGHKLKPLSSALHITPFSPSWLIRCLGLASWLGFFTTLYVSSSEVLSSLSHSRQTEAFHTWKEIRNLYTVPSVVFCTFPSIHRKKHIQTHT